jgi:predicted 3-demethylubiquinone-9 3-methyltransferase (glyoxalase superfamily)
VIPSEVFEMLADPDRDRAARAHSAVMQMVKLDLAEIRRAYKG